MIRVAEFLLVRFQDRFGIPKWRILISAWCLTAVLGVIHDLMYGRPVVPRVLLAAFLIAVWNFQGPALKAEQQHADTKSAIVINGNKTSPFLTVLRWLSISCLIVGFVPPIRLIDPIRDSLMVIAASLMACNTFPMVGPTFKEKLRNLFTFRRAVTAKS